jgi:hypothetical protein
MLRRMCFMGAGLVGGLSMLVFVGAPAGAATVIVKVNPNKGLSDGQQVKVKATGLKHGKIMEAIECNGSDQSSGRCNLANIDVGTSSSTGSFKTKFAVNETFSSSDGSVNCAPGNSQCEIVVAYGKSEKEVGSPVAIYFGAG